MIKSIELPGAGNILLPESGDLPALQHHTVALQAFLAKLSPMRIFMTRDALLRQTKVGSGQVLDFDFRLLDSGYVPGRMATLALELGVFANQGVTRGPMIESFGCGGPADQFRVFSVMFGVTLDASHTGRRLVQKRSVQTTSRIQARSNFRVALQALDGRFTVSHFVTCEALTEAA
jgi:hypothetical protein